MSTNSLMRLLIFFDLPVKTKEERGQATKFRNTLVNDGFYMIQFSVYGRLCANIENAKLHENRIKNFLPYKGSIRSLIITEKQFSNISILLGQKKKKDRKVVEGQISIF